MKSPDVGFFLLHIAASGGKILGYLKGMTQNDFMNSPLVQDAVLRNFEIIGEAAKHVPETYRVQHPEINRRGMAGLRDIPIHEYFGIDLVNVWNISRVSIPGTLAEIKKLPEYIAAEKLLAEEME